MSSHRWQERHVPVFSGKADTHIETGEVYRVRSLVEIIATPPGSQPKGKGLAFIPSSYTDHDARCHAVQREHGAFVALTGDVDKGDHELDLIETLTVRFTAGSAYFIYSSPHSRPGDRRWRILIPLDQQQSFLVWNDAQHAFYDFMEANGVAMDRALARAGQPVFLPNVPAIHQKSGEPLRARNGLPLYYERISSTLHLPGLNLGLGIVSDRIAAIVTKRAHDEAEQRRMRALADARRAQRKASVQKGENPIDRCNRTNSVTDLLTSYGYEQSPRSPEDWRSPNQTSETYATRIFDDKWVSLSASDAALRIGAQSQTGCFGDAYDLYVFYEHGGDHKAAFRQIRKDEKDDRAYLLFGRPAAGGPC